MLSLHSRGVAGPSAARVCALTVAVSTGVTLHCQGSSERSPGYHCPLLVGDLQGDISQRSCLSSGNRNPLSPGPGFSTVAPMPPRLPLPPTPPHSPPSHASLITQGVKTQHEPQRQVLVFSSFLLRRKTMKKQNPGSQGGRGKQSLCSEEMLYQRIKPSPHTPRCKQEGHRAGPPSYRRVLPNGGLALFGKAPVVSLNLKKWHLGASSLAPSPRESLALEEAELYSWPPR